MSARESHVSLDRLTALALGAPETDQDRVALTHVSTCDECATTLSRLTGTFDAMRDSAWQEADAVFDDAMLDAQRTRILDRLAHLGQAARILRFPIRRRAATMPVSSVSRRWVSMAAAAGLIIGLVAGQSLHFMPWDAVAPTGALRTSETRIASEDRGVEHTSSRLAPGIIQTVSTGSVLSDDELGEVDAAVQLRRAASLRALDALTPIAGDIIR